MRTRRYIITRRIVRTVFWTFLLLAALVIVYGGGSWLENKIT